MIFEAFRARHVAQQTYDSVPAGGVKSSCLFNSKSYKVSSGTDSSLWDSLVSIFSSFFSQLTRPGSAPVAREADARGESLSQLTDSMRYPSERTRKRIEQELTSAVNLGNSYKLEPVKPDLPQASPVAPETEETSPIKTSTRVQFHDEVRVKGIPDTPDAAESAVIFGEKDDENIIPVKSGENNKNLNLLDYKQNIRKNVAQRWPKVIQTDPTFNLEYKKLYTKEQMDTIKQRWQQYDLQDAEAILTRFNPKPLPSATNTAEASQQGKEAEVIPTPEPLPSATMTIERWITKNGKKIGKVRVPIAELRDEEEELGRMQRLGQAQAALMDMGYDSEDDDVTGTVKVGAKFTFEAQAPDSNGVIMWKLVSERTQATTETAAPTATTTAAETQTAAATPSQQSGLIHRAFKAMLNGVDSIFDRLGLKG